MAEQVEAVKTKIEALELALGHLQVYVAVLFFTLLAAAWLLYTS